MATDRVDLPRLKRLRAEASLPVLRTFAVELDAAQVSEGTGQVWFPTVHVLAHRVFNGDMGELCFERIRVREDGEYVQQLPVMYAHGMWRSCVDVTETGAAS
jgi:hypothetical protein